MSTKKYLPDFLFLMTVLDLSDSLLLQRTAIVEVNLANKQLSTLFQSDVQYLAIAIIDKFVLELSATSQLLDP